MCIAGGGKRSVYSWREKELELEGERGVCIAGGGKTSVYSWREKEECM